MAGRKKGRLELDEILAELEGLFPGGAEAGQRGGLPGGDFSGREWPPFSEADRYTVEDFLLFDDGIDDGNELTYRFYGSHSKWRRVAGAGDFRTMGFQEMFEACLLEWLLAEQAVQAEDGCEVPCAEYVLAREDDDMLADLGDGARRYVQALQGTRLSLCEVQAVNRANGRILVCDMLAPGARPEWVCWDFSRDPVWLWDIVGMRLVDWEGERRCASAMLRAPRYAALHSLARVQKRLKQAQGRGEDASRQQSETVAQEWIAVALASGAAGKSSAATFKLDGEAWLGRGEPVFVADTFPVSRWEPLKRAFEQCPDLVPAKGAGYGSDGFGCWYLTAPGHSGKPVRVAFLQRVETGLEMQSPCSDGARDNLARLQTLLGKTLKPAFRRVFPVDRRLSPAKHYEGWCDEENPYLGGRTPRKAARMKIWRPVVERLVKDMEFWTAFAADNGWMAPCSVSFLRKELELP